MLTIKKLSPADLSLAKQLFIFFEEDEGETATLPSDEYLKNLLAKNDYHVLVALEENTLAGGLTAYELLLPAGFTELFLYEIAVKEEFRRKGIARRLVQELNALGKQRGCSETFVFTTPGEEAPSKFYASLGGRREATEMFSYELNG